MHIPDRVISRPADTTISESALPHALDLAAKASIAYGVCREVRGLESVYAHYAYHEDGQYGVSSFDAGVIYDMVRHYRPQHCIELGTGIGTVTAIVSLAMQMNNAGKVTSLEQLGWMAEKAKAMLPRTCKHRVEIVVCDVEKREYFGEQWTCYKFTPSAADIDMVIVDGPAPIEEAMGDKPRGDLIALLPYLRPSCHVFIDGLATTVDALERHVGDRFKIRRSALDYTLMELV